MLSHSQQLKQVNIDTIALGIDDIIPSAYCISEDARPVSLLDKNILLPPSVVLPSLRGEPIRADIEAPAHPKGTGHPWPPESQITKHSTCRYPLPYAWAMLSGMNLVEGNLTGFPPGQVISAYAGQLSRLFGSSKAVLTIPNRLSSAKQEELITFGRRSRVQLQLLWRPIAAALSWCQQYACELDRNPVDKNVIGNLIHLHIGLDCMDITPLEIVIHTDSKENKWIIPARRRPIGKRIDLFGLNIVHRLADSISPDHNLDHINRKEWTWLWADTSLAESIIMQRYDARKWFNAYSDVCCDWPDWLQDTPVSTTHALKPNDIIDWKKSAGNMITHKVQLGAVVTGCLASIPMKGMDLGSFWLDNLGVTSKRRLIENVNGPLGISALGATIYAEKLKNNHPTYLDTLPRIKIVVTKRAEPLWIDLLKEDDEYVEGGRVFFREGIGKGMLSIPSNRKSIVVEMNHEEYQTVREVVSQFDVETKTDVPVSLSTTIIPAQGNARLEVVPDLETTSERKKVYARWDSMADTGKTPEQFIDSIPCVCPRVTTRKAGLEPWRKVQILIRKAIKARRWQSHVFEQIRIALQQRYYGTYPVSSDGTVLLVSGQSLFDRTSILPDQSDSINGHQDLLDQLVVAIIDKLQSKRCQNWLYYEGWRVLAHSFANHPAIENMLRNEINEYGSELRQEPLLAVGRCIRSPELASKFISVFLERLEERHTNVNNWLRAFSELAKYRANAFEQTHPRITEEIWRHLIPIFQHELRPGDASRRRILPYSFVGLAFLLRQRAYEPSFMPPQSELAEEAKSVASHAQDMAYTRKLFFAQNAQIDMAMELQRFINYVDKKGHGSIAMADWD